MRKTTRDAIIGVGTAAVLLGAVVTGASALVAPSAEPAAVIVTDEPIVVPADAPNGLATEQEAAAAQAEADRLKAEEDARIAAEQAAAEEAARIAAEQAAVDAEAESFDAPVDEPVVEEPAPEAPVDYCPEGYIDDPNLGCHSPICAVLEDGTQVPCQ